MALEDFRSRFGKLIMELIGTCVLVLTIQLTFSTYPLAVGLVFAALVYAGYPISGAHYNPSVSLALFLRAVISWDSLLFYWLFQVIGAFLGALLGALIGGTAAVPARGAEYYLLQAFLAELVFTALLAFVVLATLTNSNIEKNSYYGLAIGIVIMVGMAAVGHISGSVFNPAVALALSLVHGISKIAYMLWIILAQALGGVAGAALYYLVAPEEFEHFNEEASNLLRQAGGNDN